MMFVKNVVKTFVKNENIFFEHIFDETKTIPGLLFGFCQKPKIHFSFFCFFSSNSLNALNICFKRRECLSTRQKT